MEIRVPKASGQDGFSLLEIVICMLLLAIGFLGVAAAQLQSLRMSADADNRTQAAYLAEEQLSSFLAMAVNSGSLASGVDNGNPINFVGQQAGAQLEADARRTEFYRSWRVFPNDPAPNLTRIQVFVSWAQGDQLPQEPGTADNTRIVVVEGIKPTTPVSAGP